MTAARPTAAPRAPRRRGESHLRRAARVATRHGARVVRWELVGAVLAAAGVGLPFITPGTAVERVRSVGADAAPVALAEPAFPLAVALLARAARRPYTTGIPA